MLGGLAILLGFQLAGELLTTLIRLPIPGPICGMSLLLVGLFVRGRLPVDVGIAADGILRNMAILFVPAGVGIMAHADLFGPFGLSIAALLVGSTLITFVVTGLIGQIVSGTRRATTSTKDDTGVDSLSPVVSNQRLAEFEIDSSVGDQLTHLSDK